MSLHRLLLAAGALLLGVASSYADTPQLHEGEYEITTQMKLPGMPFVPPPVTVKHCLTKKDPVPKPPAQHGKCEVSTVKSEGGKVSWHVSCQGEHPVDGTGEVTYTADGMSGHSTFNMVNPRTKQPMVAEQTISGKRLGPCPK